MTFTTPLAFLLLLLAPYFFWLGRPTTQLRRWREWMSLALRLIILMLLVLSLAGTEVVQAADRLAVVFLVDASDSISQAQAEEAEQFVRNSIAHMQVGDETAVILFGANALVERPMSGLAELAPITSVPQALHTDIGEAIRLGLALFPAGSARRIVIVSDGTATTGDAAEAARLAAASGVSIDSYHLARPANEVEALLTDVSAPARVSQGEAFRIDIMAESTSDMAASLRVLAGGNVVYEESVQLRTGVNNFAVRLRAAEQEFARYRIQLTPSNDTYFQNNELAAFTEIVGPPRVLLVANDGTTVADDGTPIPDESPALLAALQATGLQVDRVTPANLPASLGQLSNYGSVILMNVNAKNLSPRKMEVLQSYVRDLGGGLVAIGGPESYGMGGYFRTPLEETLPVDMQIKDQERFPSVSIVIVIDRSGSMGQQEGGLTKIQLAAEGAVRVVELLNDFDEISVIPVDTQPDNPIGPLSASEREEAISLIRQIGAGGGGIYVRTGLEAAAEALAQSPNEVKHIILLADGSDSEQKEGVPELLQGLVAEGVTLSAVSIGNGPDTPWLQQIAEQGNGRFHFTDRAANLPQIFTQETTSIQRSYLIEERFFPELVSNSPILSGIQAVPPLLGYVGASPKGTAQVILNTHQGDPLLAAWQYGLGRSVAWTSDASGRWATEWVQWEGFPAFWAQAVRWTISQSRDSNVETVIDFTGEQANLIVDARGANEAFLNNLTMAANIVAPDGGVENVLLQQVAPGRYETDFVPQEDGAYFIRIAGNDANSEDEAVIAQTSGWVLGYSPEYQQFETNPELLANVVTVGNGRDLSDATAFPEPALSIFEHNLTSTPSTEPIWPLLMLIAVVLLPVDIAVRRLVVTRRDMERAWAATFGRWRPQTMQQERSEQVSRLFEAKRRVGTGDDGDNGGEVNSETAVISPPISRQDAVKNEPSSQTTQHRPPPQRPSKSAPSSDAGSLASRLLQKKKNQQQDQDSKD